MTAHQLTDPGQVTVGAQWRHAALCAQTDPEAFFPRVGTSPRAAQQVCMACPVRTDCLTAALENNERYGIWGGTTETQRRRLRRLTTVERHSA